MRLAHTLSVLCAASLLLAACATPAAPTAIMLDSTSEASSTAMMDNTSTPAATHAPMMANTPAATPSPMLDNTSPPEALTDKTPEAMVLPAWFSVQLSDARTGATFTLADWQGKVILVEAFAVWCPKCLQQQQNVKTLHGLLGQRDDFVSVGLGVDPNEDTALLQSYLTQHGFDWAYAVAPTAVARELGQLYGDQFLNPTATPMLIIDRHGEAHLLPFGIKSADDLYTALEPFLQATP